MRQRRTLANFWSDADGAAAVELAMVAPMLLLVLAGLAGWAGYLWTVHAVQRAANRAALAAAGGLDGAERARLAQDAAARDAADHAGLRPARLTTQVSRQGDRAVVRVRYDVTDSFVSAFARAATLSGDVITRSASVRLWG